MIALESCRASGFCLPSGRPISYICQKQSLFPDGFYDQRQISVTKTNLVFRRKGSGAEEGDHRAGIRAGNEPGNRRESGTYV